MSTCNFKARTLNHTTREQELVCAVGKVAKLGRHVVVFVVYVPPSSSAAYVAALAESLATEIASVKSAIKDPLIYVCGDFNRRDIGRELAVAGDLQPLPVGPTRGAICLDRIYTYEPEAVFESNVLPPLHNGKGMPSDHGCVYVGAKFRRERNFNWVVKMHRVRTQQKEVEFARDLVTWDWTPLRQASDVDAMASELEHAIAALTERHFPLVRVRKRSNEDPWITRSIRRLWKKKIRQYKKGGKTPKWWDIDRKLQEAIAAAKDDYVERLLLDGNNGRPFYAATRKLLSATSSAPWTVMDLYIGMRPAEVCNEVLGFFSGIAGCEAPPMPDIPRV